jgi:hypothetical protein
VLRQAVLCGGLDSFGEAFSGEASVEEWKRGMFVKGEGDAENEGQHNKIKRTKENKKDELQKTRWRRS